MQRSSHREKEDEVGTVPTHLPLAWVRNTPDAGTTKVYSTTTSKYTFIPYQKQPAPPFRPPSAQLHAYNTRTTHTLPTYGAITHVRIRTCIHYHSASARDPQSAVQLNNISRSHAHNSPSPRSIPITDFASPIRCQRFSSSLCSCCWLGPRATASPQRRSLAVPVPPWTPRLRVATVARTSITPSHLALCRSSGSASRCAQRWSRFTASTSAG